MSGEGQSAGLGVRQFAQRLFGGVHLSNQAFVVRGATGTFALRAALGGIQFATGILLARLLGVDGLGVYTYALSWAMLTGVPANFGLPQLVIRETARNVARDSWPRVAGLWRWSFRVTLASGVSIAVVGWSLLYAIGGRMAHDLTVAIALALLSVPLLALVRLGQAVLQGLRRVVVAQMPEMLLLPGLFLAATGVMAIVARGSFGPVPVMALYVFGTACALVVMVLNVRRFGEARVWRAAPQSEPGVWMRSALPLLFLGGMHIVNSRADILILGSMAGTQAVGLYGVAVRGAELVTFVFTPVSRALEPLLAGLHGKGDRAQLQRVVTVAARVTLVLSLPIVIGFVVAGRWFLSLFGPEFVASYVPLIILSVSQLVNVSCGSVSLVLVMTGHERSALRGIVTGATASVLLNPVCIYLWGVIGAAVATLASVIVWNAVMVYALARREGLDATAFGLMPGRLVQGIGEGSR